MKTKNILLSCAIWCLIVLSGLLTFSCDKIKDDAKPLQPELKTEYFTRPNTPFVINMTKRHTITQNTTLRLKNAPTHGNAQFMGRDFLVYTPDNNVQGMTDVINYEVCTDGNCQEQNINVQITATNSTQDSVNTCLQTTFSAVGTVQLANPATNTQPIYLNVSQNGYLCASYNLSTLQIISPPSRGTAQASQIPGTINWGIKYTYNPNSSAQNNPDYFIYSITLATGDTAYGVGIVNIITYVCPLNAVTDTYNAVPANLIFNGVPLNQAFNYNVLENDQYCESNLLYDTLQSFKIITPPVAGQVTGLSVRSKFIQYKPNTSFIGIDSLKYQLQYANGTTSQAWARFNVICFGIPSPDSYTFPNTQITNNTVDLSVLDNDQLCNGVPYTLSLISSSMGNINMSVVNNNTIRCVLPSATYTGSVNFTYRINTNGIIRISTVNLTITN